jgi:hypothetical protein
MSGGPGVPAAGATGDPATDRVKLKKWSAVTLWTFHPGGWSWQGRRGGWGGLGACWKNKKRGGLVGNTYLARHVCAHPRSRTRSVTNT